MTAAPGESTSVSLMADALETLTLSAFGEVNLAPFAMAFFPTESLKLSSD